MRRKPAVLTAPLLAGLLMDLPFRFVVLKNFEEFGQWYSHLPRISLFAGNFASTHPLQIRTGSPSRLGTLS
jgi:hypothetical protein